MELSSNVPPGMSLSRFGVSFRQPAVAARAVVEHHVDILRRPTAAIDDLHAEPLGARGKGATLTGARREQKDKDDPSKRGERLRRSRRPPRHCPKGSSSRRGWDLNPAAKRPVREPDQWK